MIIDQIIPRAREFREDIFQYSKQCVNLKIFPNHEAICT